MKQGIGDCPYHDVDTSEGAVPDDAKAQEGQVAICWDGSNCINHNSPGKAFCTYKDVAPDDCKGGAGRQPDNGTVR